MKRVSVFIAVVFAAIFIASINAISEEPEYENPEIDLKFNLKEDDGLSPQNRLPEEAGATKTVTADVDYDVFGIKIGRNPVHVGTWTSEPVTFDVALNINSFDVWWEVLDTTQRTSNTLEIGPIALQACQLAQFRSDNVNST